MPNTVHAKHMVCSYKHRYLVAYRRHTLTDVKQINNTQPPNGVERVRLSRRLQRGAVYSMPDFCWRYKDQQYEAMVPQLYLKQCGDCIQPQPTLLHQTSGSNSTGSDTSSVQQPTASTLTTFPEAIVTCRGKVEAAHRWRSLECAQPAICPALLRLMENNRSP